MRPQQSGAPVQLRHNQTRRQSPAAAKAAGAGGASPPPLSFEFTRLPLAGASTPVAFFRGLQRCGGSAAEGFWPLFGMAARDRDVLPLPLGASLDVALLGASATGTSPGQKRRARKQRAVEMELRAGIAALNSISAPGQQADEARPLSGLQQKAVKHLVSQYAAQPSIPSDLADTLGAWQALQGTATGYGDDAGRTHISYEQGKVSLPSGSSGGVPLASVLPEAQQSVLEGCGLLG